MKQSHSPHQPRFDRSEVESEVEAPSDTLAREPFDLVLPIVDPSSYCQLPAYIGSVPTARFIPHFLRKLVERSPSKAIARDTAYTLFKELTPCVPAQERDYYFDLAASSFGLSAPSTQDLVAAPSVAEPPATNAAALRCYTNMDFSDALYALKAQLFVARRGWGGGRWLGLKRGDAFLGQFFFVETVTGPRSAYTAPQEDLLASDWYVL